MDVTVATAFLETFAQLSVTLLAIYLAVIVFFLQDKDLAKVLVKDNLFLTTLVLTFVLFSIQLFVALFDLTRISNLSGFFPTYYFLEMFFALFALFCNFGLAISRKRKLVE